MKNTHHLKYIPLRTSMHREEDDRTSKRHLIAAIQAIIYRQEDKRLNVNDVQAKFERCTGQELQYFLKQNETIHDFMFSNSEYFLVQHGFVMIKNFDEYSKQLNPHINVKYILTDKESVFLDNNKKDNSKLMDRLNLQSFMSTTVEVISLIDDENENLGENPIHKIYNNNAQQIPMSYNYNGNYNGNEYQSNAASGNDDQEGQIIRNVNPKIEISLIDDVEEEQIIEEEEKELLDNKQDESQSNLSICNFFDKANINDGVQNSFNNLINNPRVVYQDPMDENMGVDFGDYPEENI